MSVYLVRREKEPERAKVGVRRKDLAAWKREIDRVEVWDTEFFTENDLKVLDWCCALGYKITANDGNKCEDTARFCQALGMHVYVGGSRVRVRAFCMEHLLGVKFQTPLLRNDILDLAEDGTATVFLFKDGIHEIYSGAEVKMMRDNGLGSKSPTGRLWTHLENCSDRELWDEIMQKLEGVDNKHGGLMAVARGEPERVRDALEYLFWVGCSMRCELAARLEDEFLHSTRYLSTLSQRVEDGDLGFLRGVVGDALDTAGEVCVHGLGSLLARRALEAAESVRCYLIPNNAFLRGTTTLFYLYAEETANRDANGVGSQWIWRIDHREINFVGTMSRLRCIGKGSFCPRQSGIFINRIQPNQTAMAVVLYPHDAKARLVPRYVSIAYGMQAALMESEDLDRAFEFVLKMPALVEAAARWVDMYFATEPSEEDLVRVPDVLHRAATSSPEDTWELMRRARCHFHSVRGTVR